MGHIMWHRDVRCSIAWSDYRGVRCDILCGMIKVGRLVWYGYVRCGINVE